MSLTLRIEYSDGTTTDVAADMASTTRALDEQDRAEVQVARDDWTSAAPSTPRTAKLYVREGGTREFGGRLDDVQTGSGTVTVRINSPEIDAAEAEPTAANKTYQNVGDDTIVTDQVQAVPTLSTGTITQQASAISYSASFASRSKVLYDLRKATGSEFRYNDDWTVDYVDRLGSDKSGSVTLGPAAGNIGDDFSKKQDVRENVTHVQALGAQSGPDQITATAVAPSYSSGRKIWRRYENKEVVEQSRLQSIADELVAEYDGEPRALTVECTVYPNQISADLALGDTVDVDYPEEDIQRSLRITTIMFEWTRRGFLALLTLSNRALTGEDRETKARDDLQRFNRGYQGFVDRNQTTSGWNPAGDGTPQTLEIPAWPDDIVSEERVELTVQGRAWRSPVEGTGHSHDVTVTHPNHAHSIGTTSGDNSELTNVVTEFSSPFDSELSVPEQILTVGTAWKTVATLSPSANTSNCFAFIGVDNGDTDARFAARVNNTSESTVYDGSIAHLGSGATGVFPVYVPENVNGDSLDLQIRTEATDGVIVGASYQFVGGGQHTHGVNDTSTAALGTTETATTDSVAAFQPGVVDTFDGLQYYPTDVEIAVDGSTVATLAGDSTTDWQQTIDLSGKLDPGSNTITATPTGQRGEVNLTLSSELFRRGPTS